MVLMQTGQCSKTKATGYCGHKKKYSRVVIKQMAIVDLGEST